MLSANKLKRITAIAIAVLGLIVIILGITLLGEHDSHSSYHNTFSYSPMFYASDNASFGADFYTYIYDASDTIVDELNAINIAMGTVVDAQNSINKNVASSIRATDDLITTVSKTGGILTISIGIAILAYALHCAGIAFASEDTSGKQEASLPKTTETEQVSESVETEPANPDPELPSNME